MNNYRPNAVGGEELSRREAKDGGDDRKMTEMGPQFEHRLFRMATQLEAMQAQLDQLVSLGQSSDSQVEVLTRHFTRSDATQSIEERLAELLTRMEVHQEQLDEMLDTTKKLTRTQFKSNTLAESKKQQIASALAALQEIATHRERLQEVRQDMNQERQRQFNAQIRGELVAELLPVLDGVELALDSGRSLLERRRQQRQIARQAQEQTPNAQPGMVQRTWQRLRRSWNADSIPAQSQISISGATRSGNSNVAYEQTVAIDAAEDRQMQEGLEAWLTGLSLVRERFLGILAEEGIEVIAAQDQPFDPKLHVALSAKSEPDVADGTVVEVVRKGYHQHGRVLRYAEVVVAQSSGV